MIFLLAKEKQVLFLMLTEQDVNNMRGGRTEFVDERQLQGEAFTHVILSLHKSNEAALELLRESGHVVGNVVQPEAMIPKEEVCDGCKGIMAKGTCYAGKCPMCWKETADHYRELYKGSNRDRH